MATLVISILILVAALPWLITLFVFYKIEKMNDEIKQLKEFEPFDDEFYCDETVIF